MGWLGRIREGLSRTTQQIVDRFDEIARRADEPERRSRPVDVETIEALEELLISADIGVAATDRIIAAIKTKSRNGTSLRGLVKQEILDVFAAVDHPVTVTHAPRVTLVVGVNGTGKTTTVGKLANLLKIEGRRPLICAADTFRAAAVEQLEIWAKRANLPVIAHAAGADPSAVVYDALDAAAARGTDVVVVDTAGRLHTKSNLMEELAKIRRTISKRLPDAQPEVVFVLDATTGQNGLIQARSFHESAPLSGIILTKLDTTSRGGIAFAIEDALKVPVLFVGVGEGLNDLLDFQPNAFVEALFN